MVEASLQLLVVIPTLIDKFWDQCQTRNRVEYLCDCIG